MRENSDAEKTLSEEEEVNDPPPSRGRGRGRGRGPARGRGQRSGTPPPKASGNKRKRGKERDVTSPLASVKSMKEKDIPQAVSRLHSEASFHSMSKKAFQTSFSLDVRKLVDPSGLVKIRRFDQSRINTLRSAFAMGSLTSAKVLMMNTGKTRWSTLDAQRLQVHAYCFHYHRMFLTKCFFQEFLDNSSSETIAAELGSPVVIGGYHSSKAYAQYCNDLSGKELQGTILPCSLLLSVHVIMKVPFFPQIFHSRTRQQKLPSLSASVISSSSRTFRVTPTRRR